MTIHDPLFQPFQLRHLTIRNRMFSTAHEPAYTEDGLPKARYRLYHEEKARGGIGMTMIGGSAVVSKDSPAVFGNILLYKDEVTRWLAELADGVHAQGAAVMIQMTHLGRRNAWDIGDWLVPVAPSHTREPAHRAYAKAMEDWDIARVLRDYADAAERVQAAGLDGIEVMMSGHLIDQFWSPVTNRRDDAYGGDLERRMRFGMEVLRAVRTRVGAEFIVGVRMVVDEDLKNGISAAEGLEIAQRLERSGLIDFVNVNRGNIERAIGLSRLIPGMGAPSAPHLEAAGGIREGIKLPVFHAARVQDVATARFAIESGKVDMIAMTRGHIADPYIMEKIARGQEARIRPCVGMGYCIDSIYAGQAACIHNPATGREALLPQVMSKAPQRKKVVVIGAGPGGLEAARVAGVRGHEVVVFEAASKPGGQVLLSAAIKRRREVMGIVDWRVQECEAHGVRFHYDRWAEAEDVLAEDPDVVIVATGGMPEPDFLESGADLAVSAWDILAGTQKAGKEVILFDDSAGHPGLTCAEALTAQGAKLTYVTPERAVGSLVGDTSFPPYITMLHKAGAEIVLNLRLIRAERTGNRVRAVFYDDYTRAEVVREADQLVWEAGVQPLDDLYFALKSSSVNLGEVDQEALIAHQPQKLKTNPNGRYQLFRIGDAVASRNIHAAIYDAARLLKDV